MYLCIFYLTVVAVVSSYESTENSTILTVSSDTDPGVPVLFDHGESPVWDPATNSLLFVDVHMQNVHRLDYNSSKIETKHISYGQVNVVALVDSTERLLVTVRNSVYLLDWDLLEDSALRHITTVDNGMPDNVINEGKPDHEGRFWFGTKGPQSGDEVVLDKATLYSIESKSITPRIQLRPVTISNGLVWSLNNSVLYYADSSTQKVEAFDYDSIKGEISNRRTIIDITSYGYTDAIPDGMTIDSEGHLWVALMFGGSVLHIDPDNKVVVNEYKLPVARVTSVCWGGPDLDELFVTTSRHNHDDPEELAGAIFTIINTGHQGVPTDLFKFENAHNY